MTTDQRSLMDRRAPSQEMLVLINEIKENQIALNNRLTQHMTDETGELARAIADLMKEAFPDGDPDGHRRRHELELKELEERSEFWKKLRLEITKWSLFGLFAWAGSALWSAFVLGPHR